jgi:proline dehydrogenase
MLRQVASLIVRQRWIKNAAVTMPGVRDLAWRFVAGEDLDAALGAVRDLNARSIKATLNYVGTHVHTEPEAVAAGDAALESLRRIEQERLDANVSVKLTHLGLDVSEDLCRRQLRRVLDGARQVGGFVRIDMEESPYVERTLRVFEDARETHGPDTVGIVLQSYLRNRGGDLARVVAAGSRVRLVKGGYWEAADVVYRKKADVDAAFLRDIDRLVARGRQPAIASHDANAIARACRVAADAGIDRCAIEFQMLYGVRPELQAALVRDGYPVRAYVPYGSRWYEYVLGCVRRLPGGALRQLGERLRARIRSGGPEAPGDRSP